APTELSVTVRRLLEQCPGEPLCDACLAFACSVSLSEMRGVTTVIGDTVFTRAMATCASCRRLTTTLVWGTRPDEDKCAHCSRRLTAADDVEVIDTDRFHRHCWNLLISADSVRIARALSRQSRELIRKSRQLLGKPIDEAAGEP